jgi:hypothetical protein
MKFRRKLGLISACLPKPAAADLFDWMRPRTEAADQSSSPEINLG